MLIQEKNKHLFSNVIKCYFITLNLHAIWTLNIHCTLGRRQRKLSCCSWLLIASRPRICKSKMLTSGDRDSDGTSSMDKSIVLIKYRLSSQLTFWVVMRTPCSQPCDCNCVLAGVGNYLNYGNSVSCPAKRMWTGNSEVVLFDQPNYKKILETFCDIAISRPLLSNNGITKIIDFNPNTITDVTTLTMIRLSLYSIGK